MKHFSISTLFDRYPVPDSAIVDQVVFPPSGSLQRQRTPASVTGCALLRLDNGAIWMLRALGSMWTPERLRLASAILADADASRVNATILTDPLDSALDWPVAIIDGPGLEPLDPGPWDLGNVAEPHRSPRCWWSRLPHGVGQRGVRVPAAPRFR